jgi:hypothetical protein
MQLIYVDESGDPGPRRTDGAAPGASTHFILSSIRLADRDWFATQGACAEVRRALLRAHGLPAWTELHARDIVHPRNTSPFRAIGNRGKRIALFREILTALAERLGPVEILSAVHAKSADTADDQSYGRTWIALLEALDGRLRQSGIDDTCMLFADDTAEPLLWRIVRARRHGVAVEPVPAAASVTPWPNLIEDPILRESHHSFLVQLADLTAYTLYLHLWPKGSLRRYNGHGLYLSLAPLLAPIVTGGVQGVIEA